MVREEVTVLERGAPDHRHRDLQEASSGSSCGKNVRFAEDRRQCRKAGRVLVREDATVLERGAPDYRHRDLPVASSGSSDLLGPGLAAIPHGRGTQLRESRFRAIVLRVPKRIVLLAAFVCPRMRRDRRRIRCGHFGRRSSRRLRPLVSRRSVARRGSPARTVSQRSGVVMTCVESSRKFAFATAVEPCRSTK